MNDNAQAARRPQLDRQRLEAFIKQIGAQVAAGFNCSLSHLGDRLGLYRALAEAGPMNSDELAAHTGLHERWLREWLRHQACVQQIEYEDGRFSLSPEAAAVLAEEGHPFFFASGFGAVTATYPSLPKMPAVFETGVGLTYDDHGAGCACGIERMSSFVQKHELVPKILPEVQGMVERLEAGARVADVGCGAGTATVAMAEAFPELNLRWLRHLPPRTRSRPCQLRRQRSDQRARRQPRRGTDGQGRVRLRHHLRRGA